MSLCGRKIAAAQLECRQFLRRTAAYRMTSSAPVQTVTQVVLTHLCRRAGRNTYFAPRPPAFRSAWCKHNPETLCVLVFTEGASSPRRVTRRASGSLSMQHYVLSAGTPSAMGQIASAQPRAKIELCPLLPDSNQKCAPMLGGATACGRYKTSTPARARGGAPAPCSRGRAAGGQACGRRGGSWPRLAACKLPDKDIIPICLMAVTDPAVFASFDRRERTSEQVSARSKQRLAADDRLLHVSGGASAPWPTVRRSFGR